MLIYQLYGCKKVKFRAPSPTEAYNARFENERSLSA